MGVSSKTFADFSTTNVDLAEQNALTLPPVAAERLAHFKDKDLKSKAFIAARSEKIAELDEKIQELEQQRWHRERDIAHSGKQPGRYVDKGEGRYEFEAEDWRAPYAAKISALKSEKSRLQKQPTPYSPLEGIDGFLGTVRGPLVDVEQPPVKLKPSENLGNLYTKAVAATDAAYEKLREVVVAPKPSAFVLEKIRAEIAQLARQGRPRLNEHFAGGRLTEMHGKFAVDTPCARISWPMKHLAFDSKGEQVASVDTVKLIAFLFESELTAAIEKLVIERARDSRAISPDEKPAAIVKAQTEIIRALRLEVEVAFHCERAGISVERRKDVPAPILLGLEVRPNVIDPAGVT